MSTAIGVVVTDHIVSGVVTNQELDPNGLRRFPADSSEKDALITLPADELGELIAGQIVDAAASTKEPIASIGVALPGILRNGVLEESPNLPQLKGARVTEKLKTLLAARGITAPVHALNDADAVAAGLAATRGHLDRLIRVWTIGNGIGFGRWPYADGVWEGGHAVVTLDPKERYCGCGGIGHLEGIAGHRAMRLRFLDMEPEEVFAEAKNGDQRCRDFVELWHRALAAASATSIHQSGPGRFYFTGRNAQFIDVNKLRSILETMVKMSTLQSYAIEVLPPDSGRSVVGAGVAALRALTW